MTRLLIDGDILLYQVTSAVEEPIHWGNDWWSLTADAKLAKEMLAQEVDDLKETLDANAVTITLSDPENNWRHTVLDSYKANRRGKRKPVIYVPMREWLGRPTIPSRSRPSKPMMSWGSWWMTTRSSSVTTRTC